MTAVVPASGIRRSGAGLFAAALGLGGAATFLLTRIDPVVALCVIAAPPAIGAFILSRTPGVRFRKSPVFTLALFSGALAAGGLGGLLQAGGRLPPGNDPAGGQDAIAALLSVLVGKPEALTIDPGGGKGLRIVRSDPKGAILAVEVHPHEERSFLRRETSRFDLIRTALVPETPLFPGQDLFFADRRGTVEAIRDYLDLLKPGGILVISRPAGEKRTLRLAATVRAALEERGAVTPAVQVFAVAGRDLVSLLVKLEPYTIGEVAVLEQNCRKMGLDVLSSPARRVQRPISEILRAERGGDSSATSDRDIMPVTDDRPFRSHVQGPMDLFRIASLRNLLAVVPALALVLILLPAVRQGRISGLPRARVLSAVAFSAALGLGFVVVGIALVERLLLFIGRPGPALAATIPVFFCAVAAGSRRTRGMPRPGFVVRRKCAVLVLVLMLTGVLLPALIDLGLSAHLPLRIAASIAVLAPIGYLMGQPLPLGAALVRGREERLIPWVWGVNGALAALGSVVALLLPISAGYSTTLMVGPACYLVAAAVSEEL